jgi:hypothetical protein
MARGVRSAISAEAHKKALEAHLSKRGPTGKEICEPTPERAAQARAAGQKVKVSIIDTDGGEDSGHRTWQVVPIIDTMRARGALSAEEHEAAMRFLSYWHMAQFRGPATVRYMPKHDASLHEMLPSERQAYSREQVRAAMISVDGLLHQAIAWLVLTMADHPPLHELGKYYSPSINEKARSAIGGMVVRLACASLCRHWGMKHRLVDKKIKSLAELLYGGVKSQEQERDRHGRDQDQI